jgi:hypothetical protein
MDTSKGMTIKEIAEVCGVDERTIRRWIDSASGNTPDDPGILPGLSAKTAEAQESKVPAHFSLDEVIAIIRSGGRATLADLLADNAMRTAALPAPGNQLVVASKPGPHELAAKVQAMGGPQQVMTYALMGRVYQLFANYREVDIKSIFHIMELALARSELTGQYIMAKDVARAVRDGTGTKTMSESYIERKVTEVRALIEEFGFVPTMTRLPNGDYKAAPTEKEAADAQ